MSAEKRGLGRGLDALLGGPAREESFNPSEVRQLPLSAIEPNKYQPRIEFDQDSLKDLAESIKAQGVLQPVLVRPLVDGRFELVAGERRTRASKLAGLREIPALIRDMSDDQSLAIALIENLQRENLNSIEEAKGYKQLIDQFGLSQEALAQQVGKSRSSVANALRLLRLPASVQQSIASGGLSAGHGRALMALDDADALGQLAKRIGSLNLSVRQAEAEASHYNANGEFSEPGMPHPTNVGKNRATTPSALDDYLVAIQSSLEKKYGAKVTLSGSAAKGRITFSFTGQHELDSLVNQLGESS